MASPCVSIPKEKKCDYRRFCIHPVGPYKTSCLMPGAIPTISVEKEREREREQHLMVCLGDLGHVWGKSKKSLNSIIYPH